MEDQRLRVHSLRAAETLNRTRKSGLHGAFNYVSHLQSDQSGCCSHKYEIKLYFQRHGGKTTCLEFICDHLCSANCFHSISGGLFLLLIQHRSPVPGGTGGVEEVYYVDD